MIGIDEAGLGPVLGSMFVGGVKVEDENILPDDVEDSKDLSKNKIYELANILHSKDNIHVCVIEVPPKYFNEERNLNSLTKETHAKVIDSISNEKDEVYIDSCDNDVNRFKRDILSLIDNNKLKVNAEHKADKKYDIVGAASIVAKYAREQQVSELSGEYGDIGSGYPSDPSTKQFLEDYYDENNDLPWFARKTWKTCKRLQQETLNDFN